MNNRSRLPVFSGAPKGRTYYTSILLMLMLVGWAPAQTEQFVPPSFKVGTLEMQPEARVFTSSVTLQQVCRWSQADQAIFGSVADLVVAHLDDKAFCSVKMQDVAHLLQGAGVSLAAVRFSGSAACTVTRVNMPVDHATAFAQWSQAKEQSRAASQPTQPIAAAPAPPALPSTAPVVENGVQTLQSVLIDDLAGRLQLPADSLQMQFDPRDEKLLTMTNPPFVFELAPTHQHHLGNVSWDVTIRMGQGTQSAHIAAIARAWRTEVVAAQPLQYAQVIRPEDLTQQRVLVDSMDDQTLLSMKQAIGQQAAMDMKIGTPLTAHRVNSVPLVRDGQLVTVTVRQGGVSVQTAARAMASATYGQLVRLRSEATHDIFQAVVTGDQQAEVR